MLKRLIILFLFSPSLIFAQFNDDFETNTITNWTESTVGCWAASDISPLNGSYSLHHIFDNPDAGDDQVSVDLPFLDLSAAVTNWKFKIKYDYNPSDGNNWVVFFASDVDANQMFPGGAVNGYALGVNYTGSDDILKLLKVTSGSAEAIITTSLNWDTDTDPSDIIAVEIVRSEIGAWEVSCNLNGDFDNLTSIGTGNDNTYINADYFGVYYDYTSSADRKLWIDDIYVGPEIVDDIPALVDSVYVLSYKKLKLDFNEEIDSTIAVNPLNYTVDGGIGNPDSIFVDGSYRYSELFFNQKFADNQLYEINIQNIEDLNGNVISDTTINFTYEYIKSLSVEIISSNEIQIQFTRNVDTLSAKNALNYSLDNGIGNPILAQVVTGDTTKIQLLFGIEFANETNYELTIQNIADQNLDSLQTEIISFLYFVPEQFNVIINEIMADPYPEVNLPNYEYIEIKNTTEFDIDLTGWKLKSGSTQKDFPDSIIESNSYLILCDNSASDYLDDYGTVSVFSSFPLITNSGTTISIFDENDSFIDSVRFTLDWYNDPDKESGGWSLERIDPLNICSGITNWKASEDANGGTPGIVNSVYASNIDIEAPEIEKLVIVSSNQLKIIFNEPVTEISLEKTNYSVDNSIGNPTTVVLNANQTEVDLTFLSSFTDELSHIITVLNIEDYCSNAMVSTNIDFIFYEIKPFDIVINEIMALPYPEVYLPNYEYIEIKNTTEFDIDLTGWKLKSGSTERDFPDSIIESNSYLILCDNDAAEYLDDFGTVSVFSSFPSITNAGTTISIFDENDSFIDSVQFTLDWYNDPDKESGGWSLERIDPLNICSSITNWKASEDPNGGTPGIANSVYASNIDTDAPEIDKLVIVSSNQLKIIFNESVTEQSILEKTNYLVDNGIGNPTTVVLNTNQTEVDLTFLSSFTDELSYSITLVNIEDYCSNAMVSTNNNFTYYELKPFDIVINEIMALPYPEVNLPNYEYIEIKNTTEFDIDLTGWKLKSGTSERDFPDSIIESNSYLILCDNDASEYLDDFGTVSVFSSFPSITNSGTTISIFDENDIFIDSVRFTLDWYNDPNKESGGWSLERIDPLNTCSGITNWKASEDLNGGTPGIVNSVYALNIDTDAPGIEKLVIVSSNQLKIIFNEPVTEISLLEKTNYSVDNGLGNPFSVSVSSDLQEVDILFLNIFPEKINLTLSIENLTDECGNIIAPTEIDFVYNIAQPNDIVFNEIMIDPEPSMALPEYEYIELYNNSDFNINLLNWTLTVGSTIKILSSAIINSGQYLILCNTDAAKELQVFGDILKVSGFQSLSNTEQTLILQNPKKEIISQISYFNEWYQDDYKAEGGWSLEQIDPMNPCGGANNWIASNSETGGTPGQENSVKANNPDLDAPELLRIGFVDEQHIQLFFNETIDSLSAMQTNIYSVDHSIGNPIFVDLIGIDYKSIILEFDEEFDISTIYTLEISGGIYDCAGNEIYDKNSALFSIPGQVQENDLIINEVLFNPLAGGFDFVEIYNRSEKTIDLHDVLIASFNDDELDFTSIKEITNEAYLIFPGDYIVLTEDPVVVQNQYMTSNPERIIKLKNLPGFNDDLGRVMLLDKLQNRIDNFGYNEDMHFALLATNEGVSLERINFDRPVDDQTNWHSASELVGFATPAYENSQFMELEDIEDEIRIEPETFSPDNDGFDDFTNINFTFDEPGYVANIKIYDSKGRLIRHLANNMLLGIDGVITWDGLDEKNQKASVGIYVVFVEIFDMNGNVKQYRKSVVLAAMW
ncbi:MAG: hypothetical protein GQ564_07655 [Bacteroidales bacterium]|nr:hypothetical protein [Bacteroidales bacterium]